ncbi:MAG TPA: hypothetical protein VFR81_03100 [Longimicrobium sp.]|nr:hypothetical protein [Longimicrobium sp.]
MTKAAGAQVASAASSFELHLLIGEGRWIVSHASAAPSPGPSPASGRGENCTGFDVRSTMPRRPLPPPFPRKRWEGAVSTASPTVGAREIPW